MQIKKTVFVFLLLIATLAINAQTNKSRLSGTVTDNTGEPLPGVTVSVSVENIGTITDIDGKYSLEVRPNSSITFTYLGFKQQTIKAEGKTLNVVMQEDNKVLDEVVVVGYGVQKRRDVTGAVVSIKPSDMQNMPNVNIVQSLQGKLPGLNITNTGSSAEGKVKMRVRAKNSISADAGPLIVLDGIQFEGSISEISPNDIESIEILKDASSAAIYGARAAGGVLLITSKKGAAGKTSITFNSSVGISKIINRPDMMNGAQFYNFKKERTGVGSYDTEQFEKGVDTDWLDLAMQTGVNQEYSLSIAGGNDKTKYYVSGNVSQVKGVAKNDEFNRYNLRINLTTDITSWLQYGTNTVLGYYDRPGQEADLMGALKMNPLTEPYNKDGSFNLFPNRDNQSIKNPLEGLNIEKEDVARSVNTTNFLLVKFPFLQGLSFKTVAGYYFRSRLVETYENRNATLEGKSKAGVAKANNQYVQDWSIENILNYNRQFGLHAIDFTGVYTSRENVTKNHNNMGVGFGNDFMTYYQFKLATTLSPTDGYRQERALSQLFRANYNFDSRYLLTFSIRRDGFSAFGKNNKYGTFPSVALGWNIEREKFMNAFTPLDRAKLRASYGESGNQAITPYQTMPTMSNGYYLDNKGNPLVGFYPNKLADPTLSWETTRQFNLGLDFSFLKGRISGSFDTFFATTVDLLLNKKIPQPNGVGSIRQNIGKTRSHGVELSLSTINVKTKDFTWTTDFNISHNRNKIVDVGLFDHNGKAVDNLASRWFIGKPIDVIYAYKFDGIWQETDNILTSHMPEARPGDMKIRDVNGDGKVTADDMTIIGYPEPDYTIGLMNTLSYKDISLSFFFNAVHGVTRYTEYMNPYFGDSNIRQREWWTPENKINTYPANRESAGAYGTNYLGKTNDASYIRLSDISLSYSFPKSVISKVGVNKLEVYGNVKNVFTLTNYIGLDPEFSADYDTPQTRTFLFGFRVAL